jgi:DisA bacterial checkpoint controller nucleotide-binding
MLADREFILKITEKHQLLATFNKLTNEEIEKSISAVYFASIRLEEGEKILPRVLIAKTESEFFVDTVPFLSFNQPIKLTPEALRKLTLAFNQVDSCFLVIAVADSLEIIGVSHESWKGAGATKPRRHASTICITTLDVGTISVAAGSSRLGIFRDGTFHATRHDIFQTRSFLNLVSANLGFYSNHEKSSEFAISMQRILTHAMAMSHGGIIIATKDYLINSNSHLVETGTHASYRQIENGIGNGANQLGYKNNVLDGSYRLSGDTELSASRVRFLHFISNLSCIDGALILNEKLYPKVFGAKLICPKYDGNVYMGGDKSQNVGSDIKEVGTRHLSALRYVAAAKECVAFVISSDGPVSVFVNMEDGVAWWRNAIEKS